MRGRGGGAPAKIPIEVVRKIRERHVKHAKRSDPNSAASLAEEYGVSEAYVYDLVRYRSRRGQ